MSSCPLNHRQGQKCTAFARDIEVSFSPEVEKAGPIPDSRISANPRFGLK
jgi:hypothetical protein